MGYQLGSIIELNPDRSTGQLTREVVLWFEQMKYQITHLLIMEAESFSKFLRGLWYFGESFKDKHCMDITLEAVVSCRLPQVSDAWL